MADSLRVTGSGPGPSITSAIVRVTGIPPSIGASMRNESRHQDKPSVNELHCVSEPGNPGQNHTNGNHMAEHPQAPVIG